MKKILLLLILLLSFTIFSQYEEDEEDTSEFYAEYSLLQYKPWYIEEFVPSKDNIDWDVFTKLIYNPYVNNIVLDSILSFRESKGYKPIDVKWLDIDNKMREFMIWQSMDISLKEKSKVTLGRFEEDPKSYCECTNSIIDLILDDSTLNNKGHIFKNYFLSNRVKRIEVYYYQVSRSDNQEENEEHIFVKIKKRFSLFNIQYPIY